MKLLSLIILFTSQTVWSRPIVLITYYDGFNGAGFNNSGTVAKLIAGNTQIADSVQIKLCPLSTVFDKAYDQQENCIKDLPESPKLVIGLGEASCIFKVELMGRNFDQTVNADNEGNRRYGTEIIPDAPTALGFTYPLAQMYCALDSRQQRSMDISNSAGSFVCNNTAYQMSYNNPEIPYGFIHVPSYYCNGLEVKNQAIKETLSTMILRGIKVENPQPLPTTKKELKALRKQTDGVDDCKHEFYKRAKGIDEKSFWSK